MADPLNPADWMQAWAGAEPTGQAGTDAIRRIKEFGDDYLGITRELWKLIESGLVRDARTPPQPLCEGLEKLRASFEDQFLRLYGVAGISRPSPVLPAFGPLPLHPESHQRVVAAMVRCQRATQRFNELIARIAAQAVEGLNAALSATDASQPPITSLRQLHDLWVECGERAYADSAHGDEFASVQAERLAATIELRFEQQRMAEEWARALQLPTWSDIDAIGERMQALRRRIGELERAGARRAEPRR